MLTGQAKLFTPCDRWLPLRWMCGNILWGYSPAEARQVTAIASFHHPHGYAWGYIRFSQLVYHTGGRSETVIELNLRHPGSNDRNVTSGHNWAIFVNPVGHDAAVKFFTSRCTAGGYRWNPDFIHLANPNAHDFYNEQCSPETPLRCEIGDLSGRLGTIDLGQKRVVMSDPNLPLDCQRQLLPGQHPLDGPEVGAEQNP
ncbi:hypothetical protein FJT64_016243 [Amphibalanus amphitrite]|uniref:Uncharacterized protein n=1 Tax=Amphibalanus amphitrite TaxID=1232801 RepID=A0A6A4X1Q1_AMPAM|nr:hypothetical protein FJT64_016243 [Amphibalanus amphitrite]